jgi:hypothetical protein
LDPGEFASRYVAHIKGGSTLTVEAQLLAKVLVVWAASFGVDEYGTEIAPSSTNSDLVTNWRLDAGSEGTEKRARREHTDAMTQELLHLIDLYGILRKPTWDGVRVLLFIWPLTQGVQTALQRIVGLFHDVSYLCAYLSNRLCMSQPSRKYMLSAASKVRALSEAVRVHTPTPSSVPGYSGTRM